jgi:RHS repeat-associated protein
VKTHGPGGDYLNLSYTDYTARGLLHTVADNRNSAPSDPLSDTATFTYDDLGRMTGASGPNWPYGPGANGYQYDALGNITLKEGNTLAYSTTQPHTLAKLNSTTQNIFHDPDGNRQGRPAMGSSPAATYTTYDADDHVTQVDVSGTTVQFWYDYTGRRVAKKVTNGSQVSISRYYSDMAEVTDGQITKSYFLAGLRVASSTGVAPTALAALPPDPAVQLAGDPTGRALLLTVALRPDLQTGAAALCVIGTLALLCVPGRRKPVLGIAIRRGPVLVLVLTFSLASLPLPIIVQPAWATGNGNPGPTPTPVPPPVVQHYHVDHLGSVQAITDASGNLIDQVRYNPFGDIRSRTNSNSNRYEFTGSYETELNSGLEYAGARFYDPMLGMFLTHDPARLLPAA